MPDDAPPVSLREITRDTLGAILELSVAESQKGFVATNAVSLAQAHFAPEAWYRAIYYGDEPAGFVMLEDQSMASPPPEKPEIGVWRFMIDQRFQRRGIGRAAMQQVIEHVRSKGRFSSLLLSYVPGPGSPEGFYRSLGFRPNDRMDEQEVVMELPLTGASSPQRAAAPVLPCRTVTVVTGRAEAEQCDGRRSAQYASTSPPDESSHAPSEGSPPVRRISDGSGSL